MLNPFRITPTLGLALVLSLSPSARGASERVWEYSVQVSASVQEQPPRITLSWPQDTNGVPTGYTVNRKAAGAADWDPGMALGGHETSFTDNSVRLGEAYEYQIVKSARSYTGFGYIQSGIRVPLVDDRGKLILLVDDRFTASLAPELERLVDDLAGDGWQVIRHEVSREATAPQVKRLIQSEYRADPANVKSVFLFGHLAVPYSGRFNPDGHPDHVGAWPADTYYGDMDGGWTDHLIDYIQTLNTDPTDAARISNRPGDGKFDQTQLPSPLELEVGRVDLSNLPGRAVWGGPATFPSETELLRKYLNKDHDFRHHLTSPPRRAVIGDYFGIRGGEAFAASGFRAFAPLVGPANVRNLNLEFGDKMGVWIPHLAQNDYLLAYGCGAGSYRTIAGLGHTGFYYDGSTTELVSNNTRAVFYLIFGSWLGDWDHEDNMLRAPLATGTGLVSVWSGRPHWFVHPLGLGATMGSTARLTQNNAGLYETQINTSANRTHIALMGDPTLRLHPVQPVTQLTGTTVGSSVALSWTKSTDPAIVGYHIYRRIGGGRFVRLTRSPVATDNHTDVTAPMNATYMVRAIKLETTPSGTYFNASQGVFWPARRNPETSPAPTSGSGQSSE